MLKWLFDLNPEPVTLGTQPGTRAAGFYACLLYTSDAADERSSVDLGGRRIIKKKKTRQKNKTQKKKN